MSAGEAVVLVVDDEPDHAKAVAGMVASPGRRVLLATSGAEALRVLLREPVSVMIVDASMPEMDGYELASLVRARPRCQHLPIVFVTSGLVDTESLHRAYAAGAVDFLQKPLDPVVVRAKVEVFVELQRKEEVLRRQALELREAERHRVDRDLAELRVVAARRFRDVAEALPQILFSTTPTGEVDYFNQRWFAYTGLSVSAAGSRWEAALDPADAERCRAAWAEALRTGEPFDTECRLVGAAGRSRWHLVRGVPQRGPGDAIESWICTCTDVDDAKRAQVELVEFRGTLDAAVECICLVDTDGLRVLYANHGASALLGFARDELLGRTLADFTADHDAAALGVLIAPLKEGGQPARTLETHFRRRDATVVPVDVMLQFIRVDGGRVAVIARDITARKAEEAERARLYVQAQSAVRVRDEFLAIASHELKTPLTAIHLQLQVMSRARDTGALTSDRLATWTETLGRQIGRLGRLIDELLDVTRVSEGRLQLQPEEVDLRAIVGAVVEQAREPAAAAGSELRCVDGPPIPGWWDPLRLEQVVTNLVSNAVKYGGGEPVDVEVSSDDALARVVVRDRGIGIAPEKLDRVFDRFERAVSTTQFSGLGLGLYIARQIALAHGGDIRVQSVLGEGSTFTLELPVGGRVAPGPAAERATPTGQVAGPSVEEPEPV